ncbi:hypothetical protein BT96DRAFT_1011577 [Gymnopus androsaceus JB14]|uniref:BRCT domain-containing protein n=1 Tax=Gymnopus androsaceus JB14 TaxID=1447944 RepID=A0A6A4ISJ5_9AGAR|nr:hypothetical protein BT96DRAFT_1011577 [Gymnopus androsaceus JB14]
MLFNGLKACFSPLVEGSLRCIWVRHGGTFMQSEQEFYQTSCFFCVGMDDPWVRKLSEKSVTVLHASWISRCVQEKSSIPVSRFVLDDYFNPIQIELFARPPRSNLRSLSSSTVDKASAASPSPRTINETVSRLKRPFSDMNSPNQDVDYSPGRIPPIKRQRIVTFSSPTRIPKSFHITSPTSKTNVESIQNRMDVSQRYESSASSCSNSPLNKCSPFPSMLQPFPLIDLGRVISLTRRSSKRNSRPRSKFPLNIRSNQSHSIDPRMTFSSFWNQIAKRSTSRPIAAGSNTGITSNDSVIAVSSLPKISLSVPSSPDATSPTVFLPGKVHLGKPFSADDRDGIL